MFALRSKSSVDRYISDHRKTIDVIGRLYSQIAEVSGARIIIDSSKNPGYFINLLPIREFDVYFIHLIRGPEAVSASWKARKKTLDASDDEEFPRYSVMRSALQWSVYNVFAANLRKWLGVRYLRVSHEEFCARPGKVLLDLLKGLGESGSDISPDQNIFDVTPQHSVSGNPSRFDTGRVRVVDTPAPNLSKVDEFLVRLVSGPARWIINRLSS